MFPPNNDNDLSPPQIEDPDAGALPAGPSSQPATEKLPLGDEVEALKAADALPEAPPVAAPDLAPPSRPDMTAQVRSLVEADGPPTSDPASVRPPGTRRPTAPAETPRMPRDSGRRVPESYLEFQQQIAKMQRSDGRAYNPRATANLYRRQQAAEHNGMEAPAGQEDLEIFRREGEQGFHAEDKQRFGALVDLNRLLTEVAIETMRDITQLKDSLLRNRH